MLSKIVHGRKPVILMTWVVFFAALAEDLATAQNPAPPFRRAPYLQFGSPNLMHVVWRTEGPIEPIVRYGADRNQLNERVRGGSIITRAALGTNGQQILPRWNALRTSANLALPKLHSAPIGTFQYEAKISDLKADTQYYYAVYDGDKRLTPEDGTYYFRTHPAANTSRPFRFWVIGDSGTGREPQKAVHDAMRAVVLKEGVPLDFWLHLVPYRKNPVQEAQDLGLLTRLRWPGQARSGVPSV